jgi:hypothetical protein
VKSYTELWLSGEFVPPEIAEQVRKKWRKQMEKEGLTPTQIDVLEEARKGGAVATWPEEKALAMMQILWPDAPLEAQIRATMLCVTYGLNPLMKHVALIKFTNRQTGKVTWEPVLSIESTRIIGKRPGPYSYVDGPRIMTADEQKRENGEVDDTKWWAMTIIQDMQGNKATGIGSWDKAEKPYGIEKGNTAQNMAKIRSERQALKRLRPAEMPTQFEVIDADFIELAIPQTAAKQQRALPPALPKIPANLEIKNTMALFSAARQYFKMSQEGVLKDLGISSVQEIGDVMEAWQALVTIHTSPPEGV